VSSNLARRSCIALAVCLSIGRAAAAETPDLRYGQAFSAIESIYALPILVADRDGLFAREGLRVESVLIPGGGERMIAALEDGTVDLAHVATAFLISAALKGSDAVAIAAEFNNPIYSLVAKPEMKSFGDLKGRVLGLADEAGTVAFATRKLLAANGIGAPDMETKIVSGTPARVACLKRGACDAVPLGQPQDLTMIGAGYMLLGRTDEAVPAFLYTVTAARRSWAAAHKDSVMRYIRALAAAFRIIREPARRASVAHIVADVTGASESEARATLALYLEPERGVLPLHGEIAMGGMAQVIAFMAEARLIAPPLPPPERFVDLQYLRSATLE
jgi:ABC-type nitrate/sulfonate/bicarbonate transport system substrate-binding protein